MVAEVNVSLRAFLQKNIFLINNMHLSGTDACICAPSKTTSLVIEIFINIIGI